MKHRNKAGRPREKTEADTQLNTGIPVSLFKKMERRWRRLKFRNRRAYLVDRIGSDKR